MKKRIKAVLAVTAILLFSAAGVYAQTPCEDACPDAAQKPQWAGLYPDELVSLDAVRQMQVRGEKFLLIDARSGQSYRQEHIQGAVPSLNEAYYRLEEKFRQGKIKKLPDSDPYLSDRMRGVAKNEPIVTYCNDHCQASAVLALKLKRLGYQNVKAMEGGGLQTWREKGFPVQSGS